MKNRPKSLESHCPAWPRRGVAAIPAIPVAMFGVLVVLAGCAGPQPAPGGFEGAPATGTPGEAAFAVGSALEYHRLVRSLGAAELARERSALINAPGTPLGMVREAILISQSNGAGNLGRALALLDAVAAQDTAEARALQALARLLSDQLLERQRLESAADRLAQQLERTVQQLRDSQRHGEQLQEKLDALANIERMLPAHPAASEPEQPPTPERRPSR
jgi:hypothetical protein